MTAFGTPKPTGSGGELLGLAGHLRRTFQLVPVKGFAVDRALYGLQQNVTEELPIREALDPDMDQEPGVARAGGVFALEQEGEGRGCEIDKKEGEEKGEELVKV